MHAFDVLGDPVRRRLLELLGISQPAVSQHLRILREAGFTTVRPEGTRRLYAVRPEALQEVDQWVDRFRRQWTPPLDALATELVRGRKEKHAR